MFKSTELFETLGFKHKLNATSIDIFEKKDGAKTEKVVFDTRTGNYRLHFYLAGREVPYEWVDYKLHEAIHTFIVERQMWKS